MFAQEKTATKTEEIYPKTSYLNVEYDRTEYLLELSRTKLEGIPTPKSGVYQKSKNINIERKVKENGEGIFDEELAELKAAINAMKNIPCDIGEYKNWANFLSAFIEKIKIVEKKESSNDLIDSKQEIKVNESGEIESVRAQLEIPASLLRSGNTIIIATTLLHEAGHAYDHYCGTHPGRESLENILKAERRATAYSVEFLEATRKIHGDKLNDAVENALYVIIFSCFSRKIDSEQIKK